MGVELKEALFYEKKENDVALCRLCHHHCRIGDGAGGLCGVRENRAGILSSMVYGRTVAEHIDPIEKKPLFHFLPSSTSYSISTVGCNFRCRHCQNYEISQYPHVADVESIGRQRSPESIVDAAVAGACRSISYTYVEPTIFYEFAYDCAILAHQRGLKNVFVSNGYMGTEVAKSMAGVIDGVNIDIKAFTEEFYHQVCGAKLAPVLENVQLLHDLGLWLEITTLVIPGWNDSDAELREIAGFIKGVDANIPWHVTAFHPTYKMLDRAPTQAASLRRAMDIGFEEGLRFVYCGNIPDSGGESTHCPACQSLLVDRHGFKAVSSLLEGHCHTCGESIVGVWK